jgi:hypothetical protein
VQHPSVSVGAHEGVQAGVHPSVLLHTAFLRTSFTGRGNLKKNIFPGYKWRDCLTTTNVPVRASRDVASFAFLSTFLELALWPVAHCAMQQMNIT